MIGFVCCEILFEWCFSCEVVGDFVFYVVYVFGFWMTVYLKRYLGS